MTAISPTLGRGFLLFSAVRTCSFRSAVAALKIPCTRAQKMPQGKIKRIVSDRGFGFIEAPQGDLFFHHSEVQEGTFDHLQEGDLVEFTPATGKKGACANAVRPVK